MTHALDSSRRGEDIDAVHRQALPFTENEGSAGVAAAFEHESNLSPLRPTAGSGFAARTRQR